MTEEESPMYHSPATLPEHQWQWALLLYPNKPGAPIIIAHQSKREVYAEFDSLSREARSRFSEWELINSVIL